jgi:hypothetical protein
MKNDPMIQAVRDFYYELCTKLRAQAKEAELFQLTGKPQMEPKWLKDLSCSNAHDLHKLVDPGQPELSNS